MLKNSSTMAEREGDSTAAELKQYYLMVDKENMTRDWYLIESFVPVTGILVSYFIVVSLGPRWMSSRNPYDLRVVMRGYNLLQVVYNSYLMAQLFVTPKAVAYLIDHSCRLDNPDNIRHLRETFLIYSWHYFILKVIDLLDTIFIVLRKKEFHITFLHVYHHAAMVFCTWYSNKYIKAQQGVIPGFINTTVHSIMYLYYFLATFGPEVQKYLWWKSHLTKLQLGQFGLVIAYLWLLYHYDCDVSQPFNIMWIINVCVIAVFFINFYIKAYIRKPNLCSKTL